MKKHHWNGNLITATRQSPSSSAANGLFNLVSQQVFKSASKWPATVGIPYVASGLNLYLDAGDSSSYVDYATSGTTWSDVTANSNDATLTNMATTAHTSSNGGYFTFDGTDDYASIAHTTDLNPSLSMTIMVWMRVDSFVQYMTMFGKGSTTSGSGGYDFRIDANNKLNLVKYFVADQIVTLSTALSVDTWYSIAAVQSSTKVDYYVNGVSVGSYSNSSAYQTNTSEARVARNRETLYTPADFSTVLFYDRALSSAEVLANHNAVKGKWDGNIVSTDNVLHLDAGDLDSYSGSGTTWTDLSASNSDGTLQGTPAYDGNNQGSIIFDGVDDYVTTSSLSDSFLQGNWTISFWVKFTTISTSNSGSYDETLLQHGSSSNNNGLHLVQRNSRIHFGLYGNDLQGTATVSTGTWYHVTFTLNNTNYEKQIFINGSLDTSHTGSAAYGGTGSNARLGGTVLSFGTYLYGNIANVLAYDTVLSATEIQQNYNAFKDRYGHKSVVTEGLALHLDAGHPDSYAGSGTTWYDLTSNDLDFALQNEPVYNSSLGGYFTFDGGNDKAEISSGWTSFDSDPFTIEIWYRYHTAGQYESLLATQSGGSATFQVDFSGTSGQIRLRVDQTNIVSSTATAGANTWKQVVFVREGTGTNQFKIYLNGSLDTTATLSTNFNVDSQLRIATNRGDNAFYDGDISIVRIYKNKGLTSDEVTQNYDAVKSRYGLS